MFDNLSRPAVDPDELLDFDTEMPPDENESLPSHEFFKQLMEEVFASRKELSQSDSFDSDTLRDQVRHSIPLVDENEEIKADDSRQNFSALRSFPYRKNSESKLKLEKEVPLPPEYPGAPYKDEMVGDLWLGPEYPAIEAKLQSGDLSREERINLSNQKARLYVTAEQAGNWRYGPLNERKTMTVRSKLTFEKVDHDSDLKPKPQIDLDEQPELPPSTDESPNDGDTDTNLDENPEALNIDESTLRDEKEVEKNFFKRNWNKAKKYLKGEFNNFSEYTDRKTSEAQALAVVGGLAGLGSVLGGSLVAAGALSLAFPPLGVTVAGIAGGLAINAGFAKMVNELWIKKTGNKELKNYNPETDGELKDFNDKVKLDNHERMKAFAIADIMVKILGGTILASILHPHTGPSSPDHQVPAPQDGIHGPIPDNTVDHPLNIHDGPHGPVPDSTINHPGSPSESFVAPEPTAVSVPEIIPPHIEHIVTENDQWEQLVGSHGLDPYSQDMVDTLSLNHDQIIGMWEKWASGHADGMIKIQMGPESIMTNTSISDAQAMLDRVIARGYPTLEKAGSLENLQLWQAELERMTKTLLPGTKVFIPKQ